LTANGTDHKGRGGARAHTSFKLDEIGDRTSVTLETNLDLTGSIAQYGRATGLVQQTAAIITKQFASNLSCSLTSASAEKAAADVEDKASPNSGNTIRGNALLWDLIKRQFQRLIVRSRN
jgi:hypothetical protein